MHAVHLVPSFAPVHVVQFEAHLSEQVPSVAVIYPLPELQPDPFAHLLAPVKVAEVEQFPKDTHSFETTLNPSLQVTSTVKLVHVLAFVRHALQLCLVVDVSTKYPSGHWQSVPLVQDVQPVPQV